MVTNLLSIFLTNSGMYYYSLDSDLESAETPRKRKPKRRRKKPKRPRRPRKKDSENLEIEGTPDPPTNANGYVLLHRVLKLKV